MSLPLVMAVYGKLPQQRDGNGIGAIALLRFRQPGPLDLRRAQSHVARDPSACLVRQDGDARGSADVIDPGMALEPSIKRWPAAIERCTVVTLGQRPWRQNRHTIYASSVWSGSVPEARESLLRARRSRPRIAPSFRRESSPRSGRAHRFRPPPKPSGA